MRLHVDTADATPPYEQIRQQITGAALSRMLLPGERLPPIRQLATDLGLAVSTIARAYSELENDGIVTTARGRGTRIAERPHADATVNDAADQYIRAAASHGLELPQILAIIRARHP